MTKPVETQTPRHRGRPRAFNEKTEQNTIKSLDRALGVLSELAKVESVTLSELAQRMKENGFDSALAIHLEEQRSETLEVKGDPGAAIPVAGTMTMRPEVFSDDFFVNEDIYVVRLDLWDVDQQAIIWQGNTVSFNTGGFKGLEKGAGHFAQVITNAIGKADIF